MSRTSIPDLPSVAGEETASFPYGVTIGGPGLGLNKLSGFFCAL